MSKPNTTGKMSCRWSLPKDLHDRLSETIIGYGDKYYWCIVEGEDLHLYDTYLPNKIKVVPYNDPEVDVATPLLGYVNFTFGDQQNSQLRQKTPVGFCTRRPIRRYKQGLTSYNTGWRRLGKAEDFNIKYGLYPLVKTEGFGEMLAGVYPSAQQVLDDIQLGKTRSAAISKEVALHLEGSSVLTVYYKQRPVGWLDPESLRVTVRNAWDSLVMTRLLEEQELPFKLRVSEMKAW